MNFMGKSALHKASLERDSNWIRHLSTSFEQLRTLIFNHPTSWSPVWLSIVLCATGTLAYLFTRQRSNENVIRRRLHKIVDSSNSAEATDPPLLAKYSEIREVKTKFAYYPGIRVFYKAHPQAEKIPSEPEPLPLLVFIHGLGGSLAQFNSILPSLVDVAPCLGIDLPGCGRSRFAPKEWSAYETGALVTLLDDLIEHYRKAQEGQEGRGVVLIAHSMGCSLAASLASHTSPYPSTICRHVQGLVAICPKAEPPTLEQARTFRKLLYVPDPVFNLFRLWDRRGGINSPSVRRFVGAGAGPDVQRLQIRFNQQSKTPVWRRMAWGALPVYNGKDGKSKGGLPGVEVWRGLEIPVSLIAGEADIVTKPEEVHVIAAAMRNCEQRAPTPDSKILPDASKVSNAQVSSRPQVQSSDEGYGLQSARLAFDDTRYAKSVTSTILPAPAAHGLLYDHATHRTVSGLIADFLSEKISERLSLGWQLTHLTTAGKWDVKNLKKWQGVASVSGPIGPVNRPVFRALKTLRKQDTKHTPSEFVEEWKDRIYAIIDISHDAPTYDPAELEAGGIQYHKFPTVSKIPPTVHEVQDFIALVERLRVEIEQKYDHGVNGKKGLTTRFGVKMPVIGVHCHYGYNRTGFFIVCYLVEKLGYSLDAAIEEFQRQRSPGIRHDHFIDTLYVRYTIGLRKPHETVKTSTSEADSAIA